MFKATGKAHRLGKNRNTYAESHPGVKYPYRLNLFVFWSAAVSAHALILPQL
jgi:hypothetical protein